MTIILNSPELKERFIQSLKDPIKIDRSLFDNLFKQKTIWNFLQYTLISKSFYCDDKIIIDLNKIDKNIFYWDSTRLSDLYIEVLMKRLENNC